MKTLFIAVIALTTTVACEAQKADKQSKKATEQDNSHIVYRGKKITDEGAITTAELVEKMKTAEKLEVKVIADIVTVCQAKGCWMQVDLGDGELMRVTFKDYGFFVPLDASGKRVVMEGVASQKITSVDMLRHYAEDAGKSKEEIEAITEPEHKLAFEASGVIVK
ncbi:MAG: DUF4920 domain-containing protein [Chitinophagales bacterium]|nr:DUF4920 domain-containing protein [Chitinophagales bacterium]